ncbi:sodium-coupled monocarboxylate transporter 1-like [Parambassis ranga]|uniref:Sodium-coupled monocarboxylate transporter 1-like n=1 Tax=Parambassis ranga TaxID=210632 RepID=A0A6P7JE21_9TELE|nr:sodium-coupled monocarboxylate transporter 1-like [Parambassis ranga]
MAGDSQVAGSFMAADYVVIAIMLVVSAGIGVYYAWTSRAQRSSEEFLTGGRKLTALPVSLSLTASFMSSITVLSHPAEVYQYGAIFGLIIIAYVLAIIISSEVFLPVFYRLAITSTNEYLELRFNKATRLIGTVIFIVHAIAFAGVTVYAPALALAQVTEMDLWSGITSTAVVCTLYCTIGGLNAVVWTDVFQIGIMLAGCMSVIIKAVILQGGFFVIYSDSKQGGRLNFWDFDVNPLRRHTFWTLVFGGNAIWTGAYGFYQPQVQRYVSCKSVTHARVALYINMLSLCSFGVFAVIAGMCLYSVYKDCDPWTAGRVSAPDQLMPYLVMDILTDHPGLPGLFFAALYSGSLSTVSSCINGLAAVTLEDLIKPYTNMSEAHLSFTAKGLSFFYGVVSIAMAGLASFMGGMMQAVVSIGGVLGGPLLGLFTLGILCPFANSKGGLSGLVLGLVVSLCVGLGSLISPSPPEMTRPLPLTTEGCNFTTVSSLNWTFAALPTELRPITTTPVQTSEDTHVLAVEWHSPSYLYFSLIGAVTSMTVCVIVSLLTGGWREEVEPSLMLMKEDTMSYHIFKFLKCIVSKKVVAGTRKADLTRDKEAGNTNPAFYDTEL